MDKILVGKPNPGIVDLIIKDHNLPEDCKKRMVMIGDRPDTDIQMGIDAGISTCLVLTGYTQSLDEIETHPNRPTYLLKSFGMEMA